MRIARFLPALWPMTTTGSVRRPPPAAVDWLLPDQCEVAVDLAAGIIWPGR
jgi:hypothetical protein